MSLSTSREKTAVLVITTHGEMEVYVAKTGLLQPVLTQKPTNMNVVLLQAAVCGVVNFVTAAKVASNVKAINDVVEASGFNDNTTKEEMVEIAESIKSRLLQIDNMPQEVAQEISVKNPDFMDDPQTMDYIYNNNKFYNIYSNNYIINKKFLRANESTNPSDKIWKANLLGKNGEDLMETMNPNVSSLRNSSKRKVNSVVYMSEIIQEFEKRGIKNVLIVDLSCSVINNAVSTRDVRHVRRSFMNKTRTAKHKTKANAKSTRRTRSASNASFLKDYDR